MIERIHTLLTANLPVVDHNLAYSPWWIYDYTSSSTTFTLRF